MTVFECESVNTIPYLDQNPGTSGLRRKCRTYMQPNYTENFIQSIFNYTTSVNVNCSISLVVGGDGRFLCDVVAKKIIKIAAANKISKIYVGQNAILSTPAVSTIIRKFKTTAGIILTASHNPGGPENDFGIKYNVSNGGSAVDAITNEITELSKTIKQYTTCPSLEVDISQLGSTEYEVKCVDGNLHKIEVCVIDSVVDYVELMKQVFDFPFILDYIKTHKTSDSRPFRTRIDSMSGVSGPYVKAILQELGLDQESVINSVPLPDFGGRHPDPNLTYAHDLVEMMRKGDFDLGAAFDGDADRNMILGNGGFFVTPSDSVAIIATYAAKVIPFFKNANNASNNGLKGVARSMATSAALDSVARKLGIPLYIVPTGWKYFGNLMDAGKLSLCGEESFGTGSDHIREKDGIWALLAWLSIMAYTKKSVSQIVRDHWAEFGRNYYMRYDYESLDSSLGNAVYQKLADFVDSFEKNPQIIDKKHLDQIEQAFSFEYVDPVDESVAKNQGLCVLFKNRDRFMLRKSGTGSTGITLRLYFDHYEEQQLDIDPNIILADLIKTCLELCDIEAITGLSEPTVKT